MLGVGPRLLTMHASSCWQASCTGPRGTTTWVRGLTHEYGNFLMLMMPIMHSWKMYRAIITWVKTCRQHRKHRKPPLARDYMMLQEKLWRAGSFSQLCSSP